MDHGAFNEGKAAAMLGLPKAANPYKRAVQEFRMTGRDAPSRYEELASDWESGYIWNNKLTTD